MKMDPTAFRAQLLQNFRVRLCPGELGAIFTTFDKDKSMLIDGTEVRTIVASGTGVHQLVRQSCCCAYYARLP